MMQIIHFDEISITLTSAKTRLSLDSSRNCCMKKALKKYTRKRVRKLKGLLEASKFSSDPEIFHQIRLEIKKLKAILELLHFKDPSIPVHKTFIPLRTIFREAGNIREPSELGKLRLRYTTDSTADPLNMKASEKLVQRFKKKTPGFLKGLTKTERKILRQTKEITKKEFQHYLKRLDKKIKRSLYPTLNPFTLHHTRKRIKEFNYLSPIGKVKTTSPPFFSESAETIGQWHDKQLVIQLLIADKTHNDGLQALQESCEQDLQHLTQLVNQHYA